jgi:hypothetical protein
MGAHDGEVSVGRIRGTVTAAMLLGGIRTAVVAPISKPKQLKKLSPEEILERDRIAREEKKHKSMLVGAFANPDEARARQIDPERSRAFT